MFDCVCVECGVTFKAKTTFATVCSSKCSMRRYRRTSKGKANVVRFNSKVKRPDIKKVCRECKEGYITTRKAQVFCSACSRKHAPVMETIYFDALRDIEYCKYSCIYDSGGELRCNHITVQNKEKKGSGKRNKKGLHALVRFLREAGVKRSRLLRPPFNTVDGVKERIVYI